MARTTMVYGDSSSKPIAPSNAADVNHPVSQCPSLADEKIKPKSLSLDPIVSLAFDAGTARGQCMAFGCVTTLTYVDCTNSGVVAPIVHKQRAYLVPNHATVLELQMISTLVRLIRNSSNDVPLWRQIWEALSENPWLETQQLSVGRSLVKRHSQHLWIGEMIQDCNLHLGRVFERHPTLDLSVDEVPAKFARWLRRIIREKFVAYLRTRLKKEKRTSPWPATDFAQVMQMDFLVRMDVRAAVSELPPHHRQVIELRMQCCTHDEIAEKLNLTLNQVAHIVSVSYDQLRWKLKDLARD